MLAMCLADHERQAQLAAAFGGQREADEATPEARHEVDVFCTHLLRGHDEVAFVFAILVVHDHHHATGGDVGEDFFDAVERLHVFSVSRSTYRASRSISRLTPTPTASEPSVVASSVCGMRLTLNL